MISESALDQLFRSARTHRSWSSDPVSVETLKSIYDVMKFGPTSANNNPLRTLFITTEEAKARLIPLMSEGNREKTKASPAVAIFAYDPKFYERLDYLMPGRDMKSFFASDPTIAERSAFQNSTLQAAYFMIAARAFDLDCGPMGGFDSEKVDNEFFSDSGWKSNIICNLGHGDGANMGPRSPRLDFDEACRVI